MAALNMNFSSSSLFILSLFYLLLKNHLHAAPEAKSCEGHPNGPANTHGVFPVAPALYVFGDSLVDSGNNNFLQTKAKANYNPYGIDFLGGTTGRFTNGNTVVDFIAKWLGLPYVPAYLGLSGDAKSKITTGVNYASGAAGILPETGTATGDILSLEKQVNYFQKTVRNDLAKLFKTLENKLPQYLAKSIFVISIGSNDYINNYLQPAVYNSSKTNTPQQFGDLLLRTLKQHLTTLYNLGARKFVVFGIGPIGCLPAIVNSVTPKPSIPCVENVNNLINIFNRGLPGMIQELSSSLQGSTFVRGEIYKQSYAQNQNPPKYGFIEGRTPCCVVGGNGTTTCLPNQTPCKNRNTHLYWDAFHPVQRVNYEAANGCFRGSSPCVPINIRQLARM